MATISNELLTASQNASEKYGIPVSVILAFAGNETAFGTTGMGKSKNNVFGIGSKSYSNVTESVEDFAKLVTGNKNSSQSKKYGQAVTGAQTDEEWITAITNAGYNSTNKNYISDTMNVLSYYNLDSYNTGNIGGGNPSTVTTTTTGDTIDLKWWGDLIVVIASVLVLGIGVLFLYFTVKDSTPLGKIGDIKNLIENIGKEG